MPMVFQVGSLASLVTNIICLKIECILLIDVIETRQRGTW